MQELKRSIENAERAGVKAEDIETEVLKAAYEINRHERRKHQALERITSKRRDAISRAMREVSALVTAVK